MSPIQTFLKIAIIVVLIFGTSGTIIFFHHQDMQNCDTVVTMKDGTVYECAETWSSDNGMTLIRGCDGTRQQVPTIDVKTIQPTSQIEQNWE